MLIQPPTIAPFEIGLFFAGLPTAGATLYRFKFVSQVTFPAAFAGSTADASAASTGTAVFAILRNGQQIGTITFTTSATGVLALSAETTFAIGDLLTITAPNPQDGTLANVNVTLKGSR